MTGTAIVTDSSAYLPQTYVERYSVYVLPLTLVWEGKEYRDGIDIQADEFYERLKSSPSLPTTSQISVGAFQALFARLLAGGYQVLALPISSGISGTYHSALQAKEMFPGAPIEVLDTHLVSMALSFQVLAAARAAAEGANLPECLQVAQAAYTKIGVYFTVDNLKYLYKGGRIGGAKHLFGTAINLKPVLEIRDGKIELVTSVISQRKAIEKMVSLVETGIAGRSPVRLSVFHAGVKNQAEVLQERLVKQFDAIEGILSEVSPAVGSHTGPGTISVAYMAG